MVVAGAGPGGYTAALHAARCGRRVLLVDEAGEAGIGGVCLNVGCIPSKALIELAQAAERTRTAPAMGLAAAVSGVDLAVFQSWKSAQVKTLKRGVKSLLDKAGVAVRRGRLRVLGAHSALVDDGEGGAQFIDFKSLVLATGSAPTPLRALPFDGARVLDSTGALSLEALPASLVIVGGGYIGVELGTAFAKLGVDTTLVEASGSLLPALERNLSRAVARRLQALGVRVMTSTVVTAMDERCLVVARPGVKGLEIEGLGTAGAAAVVEERLAAERVVVAVGRTPNTADLGLADAGIEVTAAGHIAVGADRLAAPSIAAIGDITAGAALAHKAAAEAPVAVDALNGKPAGFEPACIPAIVFSDPELATVGLTLAEAKAEGIDARAERLPLTASGRAAIMGAQVGATEIVVDSADGTLLGVHIAAPHASELIASAALALEMGVCAEDLALTIHPHPTLSEQLAEVARRLTRT